MADQSYFAEVSKVTEFYRRAFERELDRVILTQFQDPGRVDDHLAFNRHYAYYLTLLATEPQLLDGNMSFANGA